MFMQYMKSSSARQIIIRPNRSLNWSQNKLIMFSIALFAILLSAFFFFIELWPVIPFIMTSSALLCGGLYFSMLSGKNQEVITICADTCTIQRGRGKIQQEVSLPSQWVRIHPANRRHNGEVAAPCLTCYGKQYRVGQFLNQDERKNLGQALHAALQQHKIYKPEK